MERINTSETDTNVGFCLPLEVGLFLMNTIFANPKIIKTFKVIKYIFKSIQGELPQKP